MTNQHNGRSQAELILEAKIADIERKRQQVREKLRYQQVEVSYDGDVCVDKQLSVDEDNSYSEDSYSLTSGFAVNDRRAEHHCKLANTRCNGTIRPTEYDHAPNTAQYAARRPFPPPEVSSMIRHNEYTDSDSAESTIPVTVLQHPRNQSCHPQQPSHSAPNNIPPPSYSSITPPAAKSKPDEIQYVELKEWQSSPQRQAREADFVRNENMIREAYQDKPRVVYKQTDESDWESQPYQPASYLRGTLSRSQSTATPDERVNGTDPRIKQRQRYGTSQQSVYEPIATVSDPNTFATGQQVVRPRSPSSHQVVAQSHHPLLNRNKGGLVQKGYYELLQDASHRSNHPRRTEVEELVTASIRGAAQGSHYPLPSYQETDVDFNTAPRYRAVVLSSDSSSTDDDYVLNKSEMEKISARNRELLRDQQFHNPTAVTTISTISPTTSTHRRRQTRRERDSKRFEKMHDGYSEAAQPSTSNITKYPPIQVKKLQQEVQDVSSPTTEESPQTVRSVREVGAKPERIKGGAVQKMMKTSATQSDKSKSSPDKQIDQKSSNNLEPSEKINTDTQTTPRTNSKLTSPDNNKKSSQIVHATVSTVEDKLETAQITVHQLKGQADAVSHTNTKTDRNTASSPNLIQPHLQVAEKPYIETVCDYNEITLPAVPSRTPSVFFRTLNKYPTASQAELDIARQRLEQEHLFKQKFTKNDTTQPNETVRPEGEALYPADMKPLQQLNIQLTEYLNQLQAQAAQNNPVAGQQNVESQNSNLDIMMNMIQKTRLKMDRACQAINKCESESKLSALAEAERLYSSMASTLNELLMKEMKKTDPEKAAEYNQRELSSYMTSVACGLMELCCYLSQPKFWKRGSVTENSESVLDDPTIKLIKPRNYMTSQELELSKSHTDGSIVETIRLPTSKLSESIPHLSSSNSSLTNTPSPEKASRVQKPPLSPVSQYTRPRFKPRSTLSPRMQYKSANAIRRSNVNKVKSADIGEREPNRSNSSVQSKKLPRTKSTSQPKVRTKAPAAKSNVKSSKTLTKATDSRTKTRTQDGIANISSKHGVSTKLPLKTQFDSTPYGSHSGFRKR